MFWSIRWYTTLPDLKINKLNEDVTKAEAKKRSGEREPMVVLKAEKTMKGEKCKAATEKDVDKHKKLICYRCGKSNHISKECTSKAHICYNCMQGVDN